MKDKIDEIIDAVEENLTIEYDSHIETDTYAYIHNKDRDRVRRLIRRILGSETWL